MTKSMVQNSVKNAILILAHLTSPYQKFHVCTYIDKIHQWSIIIFVRIKLRKKITIEIKLQDSDCFWVCAYFLEWSSKYTALAKNFLFNHNQVTLDGFKVTALLHHNPTPHYRSHTFILHFYVLNWFANSLLSS